MWTGNFYGDMKIKTTRGHWLQLTTWFKHYDSGLVTGWLDKQKVNMRVSCTHKFARVAYYKYPEAIEQILAKILGIDTSRSYEKTY